MQYLAVGNRCAVNLKSLSLPIPESEALDILFKKGFEIVDVDIISLARECIGTSRYRRGAKPSEAPAIVDCSSLMKWLYAMRGIWLPRRSIQQREMGEQICPDSFEAGDLVFVSGWIDYYDKDPADGVGHVGIATGEDGVIHAANKKMNVVESSLSSFVGKMKFRGARRYIPKRSRVLTLSAPPDRQVESADDIRWIILQSLPRK
ncbi:MAG TPA: NlpC/P60 family protein [Candidatus Paceibacterota bacterium]